MKFRSFESIIILQVEGFSIGTKQLFAFTRNSNCGKQSAPIWMQQYVETSVLTGLSQSYRPGSFNINANVFWVANKLRNACYGAQKMLSNTDHNIWFEWFSCSVNNQIESIEYIGRLWNCIECIFKMHIHLSLSHP